MISYRKRCAVVQLVPAVRSKASASRPYSDCCNCDPFFPCVVQSDAVWLTAALQLIGSAQSYDRGTMRLLLVLVVALLTGSSGFLWNNRRPVSVAEAVTYVVGGKKGWPAVATWKKPELFARDVLVFKWKPRRTRNAIIGQKHNLALAVPAGMEAAPSRGAMPPPRAPADAKPPPSANSASSANSALPAPSVAMPPPPARAKGKARSEGGIAEGETPEGSGEGLNREGGTPKVVRREGASEGDDPRGSTAEGESTGGSAGKEHEIREGGEPAEVEVVKDGTVAEEMDVAAKSAYMFGRIDRCDFVLQHPSISRYHAVIQYGEDSAAFLMDLHSTHKTFLNKQQVKPGTFVPLRVGDVIRFGMSSRLYLFQGPQDLMPE
ncbi:unnamed protein product, partial [Closterium sp. Yama58-4]